MREKKVRQETIDKYLSYLYTIQKLSLPYICHNSLENIALNNNINKTVTRAIKSLKIIERNGKTNWLWLVGEPDKNMVLKILDFCLEKNKKQVVTPIAGFEELVSTFKASVNTLTEAMNKNTSEINKALQGLKSGNIESVVKGDLFTVDQQRLQVACAIATGVYKEAFKYIQNPNDTAAIGTTSDFIVSATDDLLSKLLNKQQ